MFFVDTLSLYVNHADLSSLWQIITVAGAHEEVEGKSIYITLRADLCFHCDAYHTIINDEMMLHNTYTIVESKNPYTIV